MGGRPRTGPIFRGIGGRFPAVNAEAVQTRELRRVRFQFMIPAFNSYFQTQPKSFGIVHQLQKFYELANTQLLEKRRLFSHVADKRAVFFRNISGAPRS